MTTAEKTLYIIAGLIVLIVVGAFIRWMFSSHRRNMDGIDLMRKANKELYEDLERTLSKKD